MEDSENSRLDQDKPQYGEAGTSSMDRATCEFCEKLFHSNAQRRSHEKTMHKNERINCSDCPKSYSNQTSLKYHMLVKHGQPLSCKEYWCANETNNWEAYMEHRRSNHYYKHKGYNEERGSAWSGYRILKKGQKKAVCELCDTEVTTKHMSRHMREQHNKTSKRGREKTDPTQCPNCKKVLGSTRSMKRHIKNFHDDKKC